MTHGYIDNPETRQIGKNIELYAVKKNSAEFPIEIGLNPIYTSEGNLTLTAIVDITYKKKIETRFRLMFEAFPNAVILVNSKGKIEMANKLAKIQFGYTNEELINSNLETLIPERFRNKHQSYIEMFQNNPKSRMMGYGRNLFALKKDGTEFPVEIGLNLIPLENEDYILASIINITERKKQEELIKAQNLELKKSEQELKELNVTKDKFFSIIAHDLKNPFNIILGYSDLLSDDFEYYNDKDKIKFISEINRSAKTTFNLLENLLTWAQSQQGKIKIQKENLNLLELVQMAVTPYTPNSRNKNITIEIDITENKIILADKYTMSTVISNLINNAVKFTPENGKIKITSSVNLSWVEIFIEDTGVGMSKNQQNNLFNINNKNNSTLGTNKESGTGLGLMLCKEFVEKNNGTIQVKSKIGRGSIFIIKLPIK